MSLKNNTVSVLNELIRIHYDRVEGYGLAARILQDQDPQLLQMFKTNRNDSKRYINELAEQVWTLEGKTTGKTSFVGKLYRLWMNIRGNMVVNKRSAIVGLCQFGEYALQKAYETAAYKADEITSEAAELIAAQHAVLRRSYMLQKDHYQAPVLLG